MKRRFLIRHPAILATLAVVLALLLHGALVGAEPRNLTLDPYLRVDETLPLLALSGAADAWTADDLLERRTAIELNPLGQSSGKRIALQIAHVGAGVYLVHGIDRKYGRKWGKRTLWGVAVLKFGIAGYQLHQARRP